ncbi:hypothetical protein KBD18_01575, partial [Patescibacteria group bacterium]|nr:hypothetical protein [Patescibacteria group bacterium]
LQVLARQAPALQRSTAVPAAPSLPASPPLGRHRLLSESFLALLSAHPDLFSRAIEHIQAAHLAGEDLQSLYNAAIVRYTSAIQFSTAPSAAMPPSSPPGDLFSAVFLGNQATDETLQTIQRSVLLRGENEYAPLPKKEAENVFGLLCAQLRDSWYKDRRDQLTRDMSAAEQRGDTAAVAAIEREMQETLLAGRTEAH